MTHPTNINAIPHQPVIDITREFDAPAQDVFRAHVDPKLFAQWMGPRSTPMDTVELDATRTQQLDKALQTTGGLKGVEDHDHALALNVARFLVS